MICGSDAMGWLIGCFAEGGVLLVRTKAAYKGMKIEKNLAGGVGLRRNRY